jgi:hypothetical protein
MKLLPLILIFSLMSAGCGRVLSAIRRHSEIKWPVTAQEVVGHWVLTTNSIRSVRVDGFSPTNGEQVGFTVRSNGTYSCHIISPRWDSNKHVVDKIDEEGRWSLDYSPTNVFRNALVLRSSHDSVSSVWIAQDSQRMILWTSWSDPDESIDLVYEKVEER